MTNVMRIACLSILTLAICVSSVSCKSSRTIKNTTFSKEFLFPMGTYRHAVKIETIINEQRDTKTFSFDGVVQINDQSIKIIVLSPFGTTLARFDEDRSTGTVKFENYIEAIKKYESKFKEYYSVLKLLLLSPRVPPESSPLRLVRSGEQELPEEFETTLLQPKTTFHFSKYDENEIPEKVEIHNQNFTIDVKVTGYEI